MSEQTYPLNEKLYEGICFGGPLNGNEAVSRFDKGFLAIDKKSNKCWVYDWNNDTGVFTVHAEEPEPVDYERRIKTAEQSHYDVLAVAS